MPLISSMRVFGTMTANVLAALSFVLFAVAVLSLHQERSIPFLVEESGTLPAVLSHYLFGAKDDLTDSGVTRFFREQMRNVPLDEAIERALKGEIKPSHDLAPADDGSGIGPILMIHAAFALFGLHARSLAYFFVLVLGISTLAFMLRFQDRRIFAIPVLFTAFTVLILSPLTSAQVAEQAPFGGMRSYAIVGILATLHWCFEIVADSTVPFSRRITRSVLLGIQIAVLGLAILVRGAPAYLLGPAFAIGLYRLGRNWEWPRVRATALRVVVPAVALVTVLSTVTPIVYPEYARAGRAFSTVWHRLFISFGLHPAWPFAGLREKYLCPEIPEGLTPGILDRNGHCVWVAYLREHHVPLNQASHKTYGGEYERAVRSAVWYVAKTYPKETLETFFIFKPKLLISTLLTMLELHAPDGRRLPVVLFVLQCVILIAFMATWPLETVLADIGSGACLLSLFAGFGLAPPIIATGQRMQVIDFNVYVTCAIIIGFWFVFALAMMTIARLPASPARSSGR